MPVFFSRGRRIRIQRRLEAAAAAEAFDLRDLRDLRIYDLSARVDKALLVSPQRHRLVKTPIFNALEEQIAQIRPALVIIDNRAQTIICDEIDRSLATRASNTRSTPPGVDRRHCLMPFIWYSG
ncbi:AAA family ATPase [Rhizobium aegyptiacum]|uniref:AAA family ATPase n=1 Tax=Rhizobium aegyptiacum TaxID=1764550 RepID=UPI00142DDD17|nr:AAA family ATPase [Rhizobium aegyptiacum]